MATERSDARRFLGNAAWLLLGEAVSKVASLAFVVIVARGLGTDDYGYFTFAVSFFPLFLMVSTWGLNVALVREIARAPERVSELFAAGFLIRFAFGIAAFAVAVVLVPLLTSGEAPYAAILVVGGALLIDELTSLLGSAFKAFERMARYAVTLVINRIASTVVAGLALLAGGGLLAVSVAYLVGSAVAFLAAWVALKRGLPPTRLRDANRRVVRDLFHVGTPLGIAAVFNSAVLRVDAVLLQVFQGATAVGLYGVAYRFFESSLFVGWSLANAALPRLSRNRDASQTSSTIQSTLALDLSFYLPLAVGAPFVARWVITALFSERYAAAARVVPWLAAAAVLYAIAHLFRHGAIALGRRRSVAQIAAATLALNVGVNLLAIPRYGFLGAGIVTFFTEVFESALLVGVFWRANGFVRLERVLLVPIASSAVMALALMLTDANDGRALAIGAFAYLATYLVAARLIAPVGFRSALARTRVDTASIERVPDDPSDV